MPDFNENKNYPKVIFDEHINIKPWSDCLGENCQHPDCIKKREMAAKLKEKLYVSINSENASKRRAARKKIKSLRKRMYAK